MNIQQHAQIVRIKKLSRYLYLSLTGIHYLLLVLFPLSVIFIFANPQGNFTFMETVTIPASDLTFLQHMMIVFYTVVFYFFILKLSHHFRALIRHFSMGDIFNKKAIDHARKALLNALVIYGIYLISMFAGSVYLLVTQPNQTITVNGGFIFGLVFFGLMYVLLWALEIGADLHLESELTI